MNKARREQLKEIYNELNLLLAAVGNLPDADDPKNRLEAIRDEEQAALDSLPESLQTEERSECVSNLDTAYEKAEAVAEAITTLRDDLQEACDAINNATGEGS